MSHLLQVPQSFEVSPLCPKKTITRLVAGVSRRCIRLVLLFLEKRSCCQKQRNALGNGEHIGIIGKNLDKNHFKPHVSTNRMLSQISCRIFCRFPKVLRFPHCAQKRQSRAWSLELANATVAFVWFFFSWKKGRAVKSKEMPLGMGNTSASSVKTSTKTTSNQMFQQTGCCPRFHVASSAGSPKFWGFPTVPKKDNHAPGRWS